MIKQINFQDHRLVKRLYQLQREAYLVEAELINFFDIPPLKETLSEFTDCGETFIGFFNQDELAGAVSYTVDGPSLTVCRMVVDPSHFRRGIAQKLLAAVEKDHQDIQIIYVSTGKDNIPAKSLYLKNGFKLAADIEVAPNFYISQFEKRKSDSSPTQ